jgi:hypothetical protein
MRRRLVVIAPTTLDAVRFAGGWLFDQVISGWDGTVLATDHADPRPLHILGAGAGDLEWALDAPAWGQRPDAIAVDADLYGSDPRVGRLVRDALAGGVADVRMWGAGGGRPVQHRLSAAARAFKAQALAAAAAADPAGPTEAFRSGRPLQQAPAGGTRPAAAWQHA